MNQPRIRTTEEADSGDIVVDGDHFERHVIRMSPGFKRDFAWVEKEFQLKMAQHLFQSGRATSLPWLPEGEELYERTYFINQEFTIELQGTPYQVGIILSFQCERIELKTGKRKGELFPKATITGCVCLMEEQQPLYDQITDGFDQTVIKDSREHRN